MKNVAAEQRNMQSMNCLVTLVNGGDRARPRGRAIGRLRHVVVVAILAEPRGAQVCLAGPRVAIPAERLSRGSGLRSACHHNTLSAYRYYAVLLLVWKWT